MQHHDRRRACRVAFGRHGGLVLAGWIWGGIALGAGGARQTARWAEVEVGRGEPMPAWVLNSSRGRVAEVEGQACLVLEPSRDPYVRAEWELSLGAVEARKAQVAVLEVEYLDHGAGVIEARLGRGGNAAAGWRSASRRSSYTRLNTGGVRRAWFEFGGVGWIDGTAEVRVRLAGVSHLRAVRLLEGQSAEAWAAVREAVPRQVRPMVELERPMELVTTAGVDVVGDRSTLEASLEAMNDLAPLARVLGFTSIESYVTWKRLEPEREGEFDFSFYDAVVARLGEYGLKWFPLLIVGSGYALPEWFMRSGENHGFVCLEHGLTNAIQSIWAPSHRRHVTRVLEAFGRHYEAKGVLEGVRLGPSGNYGESQYPAGGNWGPGGGRMHIHIGWWAGDAFGRADYGRWLAAKYGAVERMNEAWGSRWESFEEVAPRLPAVMLAKAERLDFTQWYTDSMSDWCAWWAQEARRALPTTPIYQSAGGWGFREAGTDYSAQTKAMKAVDGGTRLTNETDSYEQNVYATRLAATAARLYGVGLGYEPASSHTARGVVGRIFGTATTNGDHWFTYHSNVFDHEMEIARWLDYLPVLETRQPPLIEVAVYYPETENQLDDAAFRHLYAWGFNPVAREIRRVVEVDYLDDRLIRDGFLERYRALVFAWGSHIPADVQRTVDRWLRAGGTVIYPSRPRGPQEAVETAATKAGAKEEKEENPTGVFARWEAGDTGRGQFRRFPGDAEPPELYGRFVAEVLAGVTAFHPWTKAALAASRPSRVFLTVQEDGHVLILNYRDETVRVEVGGERVEVEAYGIGRARLGTR